MEVREKLKAVGQNLWLGHLSRELIHNGSLMSYIEDRLITGLAFNPQTFRQVVAESFTYDSGILRKLREGLYGESLANGLIYEDVRYAADLLRAVYDRTDGVDGWAVIPVSPLSTADNDTIVSILQKIHHQIHRPNVLLCLPALSDRIDIIEELVFAGVPVNIANIYSDSQYRIIARACLAGIERRINSGLKSVVSTFITINIARLETALSQKTDRQKATELSVAMAWKIYSTMRELHDSQEWGRVFSTGSRKPRLVWMYSGGTQMLDVNCVLYNKLIAPFTVVCLPDYVIETFISQPAPDEPMPLDGGNCDGLLENSRKAGLDVEAEADGLQTDYIDWISAEWVMLLENIAKRSAALTQMEKFGSEKKQGQGG